jgi:hypothetical protein
VFLSGKQADGRRGMLVTRTRRDVFLPTNDLAGSGCRCHEIHRRPIRAPPSAELR